MPKLAVPDIGTNSIHMVLAEVQPDYSIRFLDRFKDMTRWATGCLPATSFRSGHDAGLEVIRALVTRPETRATSRLRRWPPVRCGRRATAESSWIMWRSKPGLTVRVITGAEEARLIFLGVQNSVACLSADAGDRYRRGSVEVIVGNRETVFQARSLKLGAICPKDLYLSKTPPSKGCWGN